MNAISKLNERTHFHSHQEEYFNNLYQIKLQIQKRDYIHSVQMKINYLFGVLTLTILIILGNI